MVIFMCGHVALREVLGGGRLMVLLCLTPIHILAAWTVVVVGFVG